MKESAWRSKLIAMRKKTNPTDFIWAMDAKFKAGFPDIYLLVNSIPYHFELKINDIPTAIQRHTLEQLSKSGAYAYALSLNEQYVSVTDYRKKTVLSYSINAFNSEWIKEYPF